MNEFMLVLTFVLVVAATMVVLVGTRKSIKRKNSVEQRNNGLVYDVTDEIVEMNNEKVSGDIDSNVIMVIEDIFNLTGRGVAVTGKIINGSLQVGDEVKIQSSMIMNEISTTVTAIEKFRKSIAIANIGDSVGVLLRGVSKSDIQKGDYIKK